MVTPDRIRLTGLLRKSPALAGLSIGPSDPVHHRCMTRFLTRATIREIDGRDPFVQAESGEATPQIAPDLTVAFF
jgi:hypothetical protein